MFWNRQFPDVISGLIFFCSDGWGAGVCGNLIKKIKIPEMVYIQ